MSKQPERDCVIVLGARVKANGTLSHALQYRCEAAYAAYERGVAPLLILSGGRCMDEPVSEAEAMQSFLNRMGVPNEAMIIEDRALNTEQNLINSRQIMRERGMSTAAVVTSDYHLRRAMWLAKDLGIDAVGIAARSSRKPTHFIRARIREFGSRIRYLRRKHGCTR